MKTGEPAYLLSCDATFFNSSSSSPKFNKCTNHQTSNNAINHEILLQVSAGYNCNPYTINILLKFKLHNLRGIWSITVCSLKHNINIHQNKIEFRLMNTEVNIFAVSTCIYR